MDGNLFSIIIGSRRMRRPLIGARDFETFIGQGDKLKEGHGGLPRERIFCVWGEEKKEDDEV